MLVPRQSDLKFVFTSASSVPFDVIKFNLKEGISECFELRLDLVSINPSVDFGQILDRPALLTIWHGDMPVRYVHGIVTAFVQGDTGFRRTRYSVLIEPSLKRAEFCSDWRITRQRTIPQLLQQLINEQGISDYEQRLYGTHLPREYCVQPGETTLYHCDRIAAEEGLYYAWEHSEKGHRLIHGDRLIVHGAIGGKPVVYNPMPGGDEAGPCITVLHYGEQVRTSRTVARDYTFKHPQYRQEQRSDGANLDHQGRDYENYAWPGRYKQDEAGKPFNRTRLLALRRDAQIATIKGDDARLIPGMAFALEGHPREEWNRSWRLVHIVHEGVQHVSLEEESAGSDKGTTYSYEAQIIPDDVEWKAPLLPKPRIDGPQVASVSGPAGEEIHCDEWGRVTVQFPWDRRGNNDEHSSCWIRVAQNWAGEAWGHMAIPRIGQEVIVAFLDGDCDQPIIVGRTYRATNLPPYELPKHNIISTIRSKEHRGERASELRIDDTSQQISAALMSDHGNTALHLGYLTHPRPQGGAPRGEGFELRTDEHGAMRAAKGLFLSTDGQAQAKGGQLSRAELIQCLEGALELAKGLGGYAAQHQNLPHDATPQQTLCEAVRDLGHGANDENDGSNGGQPVIALSSPGGIAAGTSQSITLAAGAHLDSVAQKNQQLTAGQKLLANAGQGIGLFAHGGEFRQVAHQGDLSLQAQQAKVRIEGKQSVELYATDDHILAVAGKHLTLMCSGAYIKIENGDIELGCPGTLRFKAGSYDMQGAASESGELPRFDVGDTAGHFRLTRAGAAAADTRYRVQLDDGQVLEGRSDAQGMTSLLQKDVMRIAQLELFHD